MSWGDPISDRQADLVKKLYLEIDPEMGAERARVYLAENPTRRDASAKIDLLIGESKKTKAARAAAAPVVPAPVAATAAVPAARPALVFPDPGYYCVEYNDALRFYRVKEGKGYYAGRFFIDRFKSDELRNITMAEKIAVLSSINADPAVAAMRFAIEKTRCFSCGRMLTDEVSRLRGQGADCYNRGHGTKDDIGFTALHSV